MPNGIELTLAVRLMGEFEKANKGKAMSSEEGLAVIEAYAAIAQAEQLKRIADALYVEIRGEQIQIADVLLAVYEALDDRNREQP